VVIIHTDAYHSKVQQFIDSNNFRVVDKDPTKQFQKRIRNTSNECTETIGKDKKSKYTNLNPTAPNIRGLPEVHKDNVPIQPIIKWNSAPTYKLAKLPNTLIQINIPLPKTFNVKNSVHLTNDLTEIPYNHDLKYVSFDIYNTYSNIATDDLIKIKDTCIEQRLSETPVNEFLNITHSILVLFKIPKPMLYPNTGLAMGAPTSAVLSEITSNI
jgi:hypothetical protein